MERNTSDKTTKTKDVFSINSFSSIPLDGWMDILTDRLDPDLIAAQRTHAIVFLFIILMTVGKIFDQFLKVSTASHVLMSHYGGHLFVVKNLFY